MNGRYYTMLDLMPISVDIAESENAVHRAHENKIKIVCAVQDACGHEWVGELFTGSQVLRVCFHCGFFCDKYEGPLNNSKLVEITKEQFHALKRFRDR